MSAPRLVVLVGAAILALAAPAGAIEVQKIAGGLDNPRHLAFGGKDLYVAEAGRGGDGPCFAGPEGGMACVGATGAVTVVERHGGQHRLVSGLASLGDQGTGANAIGPHGIDVKGSDRVFVTNGGPTAANRDELAAQNPVADLFGRVLRIGRDGDIRRLVDVWGFERDNNPDAQAGNPAIDSNAVDVIAKRGRLVVADAGGNTLLTARKDGSVKVLSVFPNRLVQDPFGPDQIPMQAVPTGVVQGPHGDYFMSQLTGFPFPVGGANVFRVDRHTGEAAVFASGFTNIMDLAFDRHGTLWVLEIDHDSLLGPGTDGAIYAVDENGQKTLLDLPAGMLTTPGGITVGHDGALYVTIKTTSPGDGDVLRIDVGGGHGH
ncbi:MAG TPA: ScyD/ScyE family protein [Baekduia sp.]|nr:ScyD/ScyE family protein [Baekduia sp.]